MELLGSFCPTCIDQNNKVIKFCSGCGKLINVQTTLMLEDRGKRFI